MDHDDDGSLRPHGGGHVMHHIREAADAHRAARLHHHVDALSAAEDELRAAIHAAVYDGHVSWQSIGDALGIARGNAYQRFRRRDGRQPRPQP